MCVLIVTHSQDNESIPLVIDAIESQGGRAFRFDTDRFPTQVRLDIYYGREEERLTLFSEAATLDLREVSAVWYRRIAIGSRIPDTMEPQMRQASVQESRVTVRGLLASLQAFYLDSIIKVERAKNKQLQLKIAREIGLDIPRNLTTNNPEAVKEFVATCREGAIAKMLSSFAIYDERGQERVVFTNPVRSEDLENLDGLNFCPMTFQEQIPKTLELRSTIVGERVFTAAIDSQSNSHARHDWRRQGLVMIKDWKSYELPSEITEKLLELMRYFGLNYGAIDLILTPDNRYVFLEVNPVGEFFWLECYPPCFPISQAIAELLVRG
ncbi:MvdD family ATP-grasp ribosomal peptide maturase [Myxosarcina sp. GI1]|uniref:MvdD family ATP-grasp ribosomal peptide maturase n=1 Tax=Myxosarcina sp. GI1 TaxID=1541065 RepID=UPI00055D5A06|nr:MvdD family ATP-grasp ribosomal peptide maturase [Myxosarcina sp. GI1]